MKIKIPFKEHPCVYKLFYNDYFIVWKSKDMQDGIRRIASSLKSFINESSGMDASNPFYDFFNIIKEDGNNGKFRYEIVIETANPYLLLKAEQLSLNESLMNPYCLNNNTIAYLPKYNQQTGGFGWINRGYILNFKKWLNKKK